MRRKKLFYKAMAGALLASMLVTGTPGTGEIANLIGAGSLTTVAQAVSGPCYDFENGVLTLKGNVDHKNYLLFFDQKDEVTSIVASEGTVFPADCENMFEHYEKCESIDLTKADTSNVTNMHGLFGSCLSLKTLKLGDHFVTNKVEYMGSMFNECSSLTEIDLSKFDTSNVQSMGGMFAYCDKLTKINLSGIDTGKVEYMDYMFYDCTNLKNVDVSSLNTANVNSMRYMFAGSSALETLDLSTFDTGNVKDMECMFQNCVGLKSLNISGFKTGQVITMNGMFYSCMALEKLDVSSFDTGNVTDMAMMFGECDSLTSLDLSKFKTGKVTNMDYMFAGMDEMKKLDLSSFDTSNTNNFSGMFNGDFKMEELNLSSFDTSKEGGSSLMFGNFGASCNSAKIILGPKFKKVTSEMMFPENCAWIKKDGEMVKVIKDGDPVEFENNGLNTYYRVTELDAEGVIYGMPQFGQELACTIGRGNAEKYAYQWKRGTAAINGATKDTYTLQKEDIGSRISCVVSDADGICIGEKEFGPTGTVTKADSPAAPSGLDGVAPVKLGGSDGKITGVSTAMEYSKTEDFASKTKCTGTEITNLKAGMYYVRIAETDTTFAGDYVAVEVKDGLGDLTGTVDIAGNAVCGETLKAVVSDTDVSAFTYVWKRGTDSENLEVISGATASSYVLTAEDAGKYVFCFVSDASGKKLGTIDGSTMSVVSKKEGPAEAPKAVGKAASVQGAADGKITGVDATMEYATDVTFKNAKKCSGTEITGLRVGYYYVRVAETATTKAGAPAKVRVDDGPAPTTAPTTKPVTEVFTDVKPDAWYVKAIQFVYDNGIMKGKDGKFDPNAPVTRAEFSQVLYNEGGKPDVDLTAFTFADVKTNGWYVKAVIWAKSKDIANGYRNGKFGVSDSIQREQIALMLYKYAKFKGIDVTVNTNKISEYADSNKISEWATTAMEWAIDRGIMSGKGKSGDPISTFKLDPKGNATRAECASMIKNFKEKLGD